MEIIESMVPGIGVKYSFQSDHGQFSVVVKPDGSKEIYYQENSNFYVLPLSDDEARTLAMLLLETPLKIISGKGEMSVGKSMLRWITVNEETKDRIIDVDKNAIIFIRAGKIERDLSQKVKAGDIILSGD